MLRRLKLAAFVGFALALSGAGARATEIDPGTLSVAMLFSPTVNLSTGSVTLGGSQSYFSGGGSFAGFSGTGTSTATLFTFNKTAGDKLSYAADPIDSFITFQNAGDTYSFNLDTSIKTTNWSYVAGVNGTGQVSLFLLGDITDSENIYTATPAAFTLTLNETGGSEWSASATLATPPPGGAPSQVPEPASLALFGAGLAALGLVRRNRKV